MNKKLRVILFSSISLFALACAALSGNANPSTNPGDTSPTEDQGSISLPTVEVQVDPTQEPVTGTIVYQDDFSSKTGKVEEYMDENGIVGVKDGVYSVQNFSEKWAWSRISVTTSDSIIQVQARQVSGPSDNNTGYGVICRLGYSQDTGVDGYLLAISGDGFASIQKIDDNKFTALVDWTSNSAINTGNNDNTLKASCIGDQLTLEVNGEVMAEATDSTFTSGDAGFAGASYNKDFLIMQVDFDDLVISEP
jgi:hypothetical protein